MTAASQIRVGNAILQTPAAMGADGDPVVLDLTNRRLKIITGLFSGVITFYASATSGGAVDQLQTITIANGLISDWVQGVSGVGAGYLFNDSANSAYLTLM